MEIHKQAKVVRIHQGSVESIHQIALLVGDLYPTSVSFNHDLTMSLEGELTLHFNGRPFTLYPLNWQIAIAAFS